MVSERFPRRHRESILSAISVGFFFVLIGVIFIITPNLIDKVVNFFQDITFVNVARLPSNFYLPRPATIGAHVTVYSAVEQFDLAWGVFLVGMLVIRFATGSPTRKKAENLGDIVSAFGGAYLIQTWLIGESKWFEFWALILMLFGISLIVRAVFLAAAGARGK
jgi:hypothetical protein